MERHARIRGVTQEGRDDAAESSEETVEQLPSTCHNSIRDSRELLIGIDCYADERPPQRLVVQYGGGGMIERWNCEQETVVATDNYQSPYDEWTGA